MEKRPHMNERGEFQSDKYDWCRPGFVPLKITDEMAQPVLWAYAQERRAVDEEFSDDLKQALQDAGYEPPARPSEPRVGATTANSAEHAIYCTPDRIDEEAEAWWKAREQLQRNLSVKYASLHAYRSGACRHGAALAAERLDSFASPTPLATEAKPCTTESIPVLPSPHDYTVKHFPASLCGKPWTPGTLPDFPPPPPPPPTLVEAAARGLYESERALPQWSSLAAEHRRPREDQMRRLLSSRDQLEECSSPTLRAAAVAAAKGWTAGQSHGLGLREEAVAWLARWQAQAGPGHPLGGAVQKALDALQSALPDFPPPPAAKAPIGRKTLAKQDDHTPEQIAQRLFNASDGIFLHEIHDDASLSYAVGTIQARIAEALRAERGATEELMAGWQLRRESPGAPPATPAQFLQLLSERLAGKYHSLALEEGESALAPSLHVRTANFSIRTKVDLAADPIALVGRIASLVESVLGPPAPGTLPDFPPPPPPPPRAVASKRALVEQIAKVINRNSVENWSNTPDFILAEYLVECLDCFTQATNARGKWWCGAALPDSSPPASKEVQET